MQQSYLVGSDILKTFLSARLLHWDMILGSKKMFSLDFWFALILQFQFYKVHSFDTCKTACLYLKHFEKYKI